MLKSLEALAVSTFALQTDIALLNYHLPEQGGLPKSLSEWRCPARLESDLQPPVANVSCAQSVVVK